MADESNPKQIYNGIGLNLLHFECVNVGDKPL
jgi:hypothetical protein